MSAAVIDRIFRRGEARVSEGADGDGHRRLFPPLFGMEHGCPADGAEAEREPGALVADAKVLGCRAEDSVRGCEAGQSCEDAAGSTLAGQAVTNPYSEWFTLNFNAQLAAGTRRCSSTH
jgi:hypothetical protein